jgi:hypothetical protein
MLNIEPILAGILFNPTNHLPSAFRIQEEPSGNEMLIAES